MDPHPVRSPVVSKISDCPQTRVPLQGNEQHGTRRLEEMEWPRKSAGAIPTTVCGTPSIVTISSMISGSLMALPEVMAWRRRAARRWRVVDRGIKSPSARQRHAEGTEVVSRHVQRRHTRRRRLLVRSLPAELAGLPGPPRDGHTNISLPQRLIIRIGPPFSAHSPALARADRAGAPGVRSARSCRCRARAT